MDVPITDEFIKSLFTHKVNYRQELQAYSDWLPTVQNDSNRDKLDKIHLARIQHKPIAPVYEPFQVSYFDIADTPPQERDAKLEERLFGMLPEEEDDPMMEMLNFLKQDPRSVYECVKKEISYKTWNEGTRLGRDELEHLNDIYIKKFTGWSRGQRVVHLHHVLHALTRGAFAQKPSHELTLMDLVPTLTDAERQLFDELTTASLLQEERVPSIVPFLQSVNPEFVYNNLSAYLVHLAQRGEETPFLEVEENQIPEDKWMLFVSGIEKLNEFMKSPIHPSILQYILAGIEQLPAEEGEQQRTNLVKLSDTVRNLLLMGTYFFKRNKHLQQPQYNTYLYQNDDNRKYKLIRAKGTENYVLSGFMVDDETHPGLFDSLRAVEPQQRIYYLFSMYYNSYHDLELHLGGNHSMMDYGMRLVGMNHQNMDEFNATLYHCVGNLYKMAGGPADHVPASTLESSPVLKELTFVPNEEDPPDVVVEKSLFHLAQMFGEDEMSYLVSYNGIHQYPLYTVRTNIGRSIQTMVDEETLVPEYQQYVEADEIENLPRTINYVRYIREPIPVDGVALTLKGFMGVIYSSLEELEELAQDGGVLEGLVREASGTMDEVNIHEQNELTVDDDDVTDVIDMVRDILQDEELMGNQAIRTSDPVRQLRNVLRKYNDLNPDDAQPLPPMAPLPPLMEPPVMDHLGMAGPPVAGLAFNVHNAFGSIDVPFYTEYMENKMEGYELDIPIETYYPAGVPQHEFKNKLLSTLYHFVNTYEGDRPREELVNELSMISQAVLRNVALTDALQSMLLNTVLFIHRVNHRPLTDLYIDSYTHECTHAYDSGNPMTCVKGGLERIVLLFFSAVNAVCCMEKESCDVPELVEVCSVAKYMALTNDMMNTIIQEWAMHASEDEPKAEYTARTQDARRTAFVEYLMSRLMEGVENDYLRNKFRERILEKLAEPNFNFNFKCGDPMEAIISPEDCDEAEGQEGSGRRRGTRRARRYRGTKHNKRTRRRRRSRKGKQSRKKRRHHGGRKTRKNKKKHKKHKKHYKTRKAKNAKHTRKTRKHRRRGKKAKKGGRKNTRRRMRRTRRGVKKHTRRARH